MKTSYIFSALAVIVVVAGLWWYMAQPATPTPAPGTSGTATTTPVNTFGMAQYTDSVQGFTFWYPSALAVTASTTVDTKNFPGGTAVKTLQVGPAGGTTITVVQSPAVTITDEPANHASPIAQTKYFHIATSSQWMVAYPDSSHAGGKNATTTADTSKQTMAGLLMLPSSRRFNTTIIALNIGTFLVVSDGGGSGITAALAKTIATEGAAVTAAAQSAALQAEATAFAAQ